MPTQKVKNGVVICVFRMTQNPLHPLHRLLTKYPKELIRRKPDYISSKTNTEVKGSRAEGSTRGKKRNLVKSSAG